MAVFIKICGLTSNDDVQVVSQAGTDALGFVFWPGSPRAVLPEDVRDWTRASAPAPVRVGVFVDASPERVCETRDVAGLDIVQLHGAETPAQARSIGGRIWKAVSVGPAWDPEPWVDAGVEAFVFDAAGGAMPGGTGRCCDWRAAADGVRRAGVPVVLAGGLTPENVAEAWAQVQPWGVDVSSGVESAPGRKDPDRVRRFMLECRRL